MSADEIAAIAMYAQGKSLSLSTVAAEQPSSAATVSNVLKRHDVKPRPQGRIRKSPEPSRPASNPRTNDRKVAELHAKGKSLRQIASITGYSRETVRRSLKRSNLSAHAGRDVALPEEMKMLVIAMYKKGLSLREVGKVVGRSHPAVREILIAANVPLRTVGGRRKRATE